ncbi:MAG TPA: hypothetical protein VGG75_38000 [Trebonia sp.]|jgi:hypothetical protein
MPVRRRPAAREASQANRNRNRNRAEGAVWRRIVQGVLSRDLRVCWICRHPGANAADHVIPVTERPDLALSAANLRAVHSASRAGGGECRVCSVAATVKAGAPVRVFCNEIKGSGSIERARRIIETRTGLALGSQSSGKPGGERDWE